MGDATVAAALAKQFEPILLFHSDETVFPIDPKHYLEQCALWKSLPPYDDKANWQPVIGKNMIAAIDGVNEVAGGKTFIGVAGGDFGVGPAVIGEHAPGEEFFLEFLGWQPIVDPPVTATTENRHATLDDGPYVDALSTLDPWYFVEYLDNTDLTNLAGNPNMDFNGANVFKAVVTNPALNTPRALIYHLLYPLHNETLEGCEDIGEGRLFGSYAGEWASIAILIDADGTPTHIGLTSRNVGKPVTVEGKDNRIGMTVHAWSDVQFAAGGAGDMHPKIFVSLDTHGHYLTAGTQTLAPYSFDGLDPARNHCGDVETLDDAIAGDDLLVPGTDSEGVWTLGEALAIVWGKILAGAEAGGPIGAIGGLGAVVAEAMQGHFGNDPVYADPVAQPVDVTGGPDFGRVIRPAGVTFPEIAMAANLIDWNVRRYLAPAPDLRSYTFVVDRGHQPWWVPRPAPRVRSSDLPFPNGFSGRWGPRVTNDPRSRRAGGQLPDFAQMFLEDIAQFLNM